MFIVRWNGRFSSVPGRSLVARNVTPTVCRPALIGMRGVALPLPVVFLISLSQSNSFTRSPSMVTSSCSPLMPPEHRLEVAGDALHLECVVAVRRELILDQHPAAGAERQALDVVVLRGVRRARRTRPASAPITSPIARRLILPAADRYASINAGDIVSAPAMLSKPRVESSGGRNFVASTSSASRSRIALAYSVRLRRWRPGAGRWLDALAIELGLHEADQRLERGRHPAGARRSAASCRRAACERPFPPISAWSARRARSTGPVQDQSAVLSRALWQVTQYLIHQRARRRGILTSRRGHRLDGSGRLRGGLRPRNRARCGPGRGRGLARLSNNHRHRQHGHAACHQDSRLQAFPPP